MRKEYQLLLFMRNLMTGIMAPVLMLLLLSRGADIASLSLVLGAFSLTVIITEFPSGVFADLYGRKNAFLLAMALMMASYGLLLLSQTTALLLPAIILHGLGRAFSSGSIDALALDEASDDAALARTSARISILESAGLALGALLGGALAGIGEAYSANLVLCLALSFALLLLSALLVRERRTPRPAAASKGRGALGQITLQMRDGLRFMIRRGTVRMLFLLGMFTGVVLFAVETYWQPALMAMNAPPWLLGVVTSAGFAAVMAGAKLSERLLVRKPNTVIGLMLLQKALLGAALLLLALLTRLEWFTAIYLLLYCTLGGAGVAESILLNRAAPPAQRAGILSLFSFVTQVGGLLASLLGFVITRQAGFQWVWIVNGIMMILFVCAVTVWYAIQRHRQAPNGFAADPTQRIGLDTAPQTEAEEAAAALGAALQGTSLEHLAAATLLTLSQHTAASAAEPAQDND